MSTRRLTDIQFSENHAIDGTRIQSAVDDIYERFNNLPLEDIEKRHTLQTIVLKCSGTSVQDMATFSKVAGAITGTDRPQAPFIDHAMLDVDVAATPAEFRAKGIPEEEDGFGFVWTASTFFLKPITLESVTVHLDGDNFTPFSPLTYEVTFTAPHGLNVGEKIYTTANNAYIMSPGPTGLINQVFRVYAVNSPTTVTVIWYSTRAGAALPAPGLGFDPANPLTFSDGAGALTVAGLAGDDIPAHATRILIDCPYLQYSTDRRLNSKVFARDQFPEFMYAQPNLSEPSAVDIDMYPTGIPKDGSTINGWRSLYYDAENLNIALPSAQTVNFRLAFSHPTRRFRFPANVPRATYTITYREQILD